MEIVTSAAVALAAGACVFAALAAVAWSWDASLPRHVSARLARELAGPAPVDETTLRAASEAFLRGTIGPEAPFGRFALRAAGASAAALAATTLVFLLSIPALPASFFTDATSLKLVARQVVLNGFVSVFVATWASWTLGGARIGRLAGARAGGLARHAVVDIALRLVLLLGLSAAIFTLFAHYAGSFGGSVETAVAVVPETLVSALEFHGLSGAQVYAALLTGFPWFLLLILRLLAPRPWTGALWRRVGRIFPIEARPMRFLGLLLAGIGALSGLAAAGILQALHAAGGS